MLSPLVFSLLASALAGDSTVYPVLNHNRVAGSMVVVRRGDTVTVRYVFTDRNRGVRLAERYAFHDGHVVYAEARPVLADDRLGEPTSRLEIVGDSVRRWTPIRSSTEHVEPDVYYGGLGTPYDELALADYLLRDPRHSARLAQPKSTLRLEVLQQLTVPTTHGKERVRLVAVHPDIGETPRLRSVNT